MLNRASYRQDYKTLINDADRLIASSEQLLLDIERTIKEPDFALNTTKKYLKKGWKCADGEALLTIGAVLDNINLSYLKPQFSDLGRVIESEEHLSLIRDHATEIDGSLKELRAMYSEYIGQGLHNILSNTFEKASSAGRNIIEVVDETVHRAVNYASQIALLYTAGGYTPSETQEIISKNLDEIVIASLPEEESWLKKHPGVKRGIAICAGLAMAGGVAASIYALSQDSDSHMKISGTSSHTSQLESLINSDSLSNQTRSSYYQPFFEETVICNESFDQDKPKISGEQVIWRDWRGGNESDLYMLDLESMEEFIISNAAGDQKYADINNGQIVWKSFEPDAEWKYEAKLFLRNSSGEITELDLQESFFYATDSYHLSDNFLLYNTCGLLGDFYVEVRDLRTGEYVCHGKGSWDTCADIYDHIFVWDAYEDDKDYQVYAKDIISNETFVISDAVGDQKNPSIYKNLIVWEDLSGEDADIYMHNLVTGLTSLVCDAEGDQTNPKVGDGFVVWEDERSGYKDIYMKDLTTGEEKAVCTASGNQYDLDVSGSRIVWTDERGKDKDIYMVDIAKPFINKPPVFENLPDTLEARVGQKFYLDVNASDPDGHPLTYSEDTDLFDTDSETGRIGKNGTSFWDDFEEGWIPKKEDIGIHKIIFQVRDEYGGVAKKEVTLRVSECDIANGDSANSDLDNKPPVLEDIADTLYAVVGKKFNLDVNATDSDGDTLSYSENTELFEINENTGKVSWIPRPEDIGTYRIKFNVTDNKGGFAEKEVTLKVYESEPEDNDGMPTWWEKKYGLDISSDDSGFDKDQDGLTNILEYQHGTDPTNPDTDGDGLLDGNELKNGYNPLDANDPLANLKNKDNQENNSLLYILGGIAGGVTLVGAGAALSYFLLRKKNQMSLPTNDFINNEEPQTNYYTRRSHRNRGAPQKHEQDKEVVNRDNIEYREGSSKLLHEKSHRQSHTPESKREEEWSLPPPPMD